MPRTFISVGAVFTLAVRATGQSSIETLAVLLLALRSFAVTALTVSRVFLLNSLSGFGDAISVCIVITAAIAGALWCAQFARRETLAVHF